ncbi:MAG: hypothetical protein KAV45_01590 [Calditrichia bacterium]|jgi:hypothetical protein|nr:hypothetical protein [Calditrichia bacterium]
MQNEILAYREQLVKFNRWEKEEQRKLSEVQKLHQFFVLYHLARQMTPSEIKKARDEHLQHIVDIQSRLSAGSS